MSILDLFKLTPTQLHAVTARGQDISVAAGAGSGKTRTLVARYLALLEEGHVPRGVAAITFTEKAAREMRNRIRTNIHLWIIGACPPEERPRWEEAEADIDAARISTIHGLCAAILRAHPAEAKVDPEFEVLDEGLAAALRAQAVEDTLAWASTESGLVPLFAAFTTSELGLILTKMLGTRLDTRTTLRLSDPAKVWAATLKSTIQQFVQAERVQSIITELRNLSAARQLINDAGEKLAAQVEVLLARWDELEDALGRDQVLEAARALYTARRNCGGKVGNKGRAKVAVKDLREIYDAQIDPWLGGQTSGDPLPDPELEGRVAGLVPLLAELFEHGLAKYQNAKDIRQALDFDDLEAKALELLQRADVRARWQMQLSALLVDEFQDTNERQRQIVEALAGVAEGLTGRLFIVGDAKQSIYRFRGADVTVFRKLDQAIRARGGLPLDLDLTFRAHQSLVLALNEILANIMTQIDARRPYVVPFAGLVADRKTPRTGLAEPFVEFLCGLGKRAEEGRPAAARLSVQRLLELHSQEGVKWEDIALLFRASTGFHDYEEALENANIPFVTVAGRGFYDRPEVRDLLNLLRALADPWDESALAGLLRSPAFGLSDAALFLLRWPEGPSRRGPVSFRQALARDLSYLSDVDRQQAHRANEELNRLVGLADRVPIAELLKRVMDETWYPAILATPSVAGARLQRNVDKLLADAHASGLVRVTEFLNYIETLKSAGAREGEAPSDAGGAVRLMTVHKAKGLEFPVVVMADASRQPLGRSDVILSSPENGLAPRPGRWEQVPLIYRLAQLEEKNRGEAEDLRLLYVAATRTQEKLIVCGHYVTGDAWLTKLAGAAGLNLDHLVASPGVPQTATLSGSGQKVRGLALALNASATEPPRLKAVLPEQPATLPKTDGVPLYRALNAPIAETVDAKVAEKEAGVRPRRRATEYTRQLEGAFVGQIVHEAIRCWHFPGDVGFDRLLNVIVRTLGWVEAGQAASHTARAIELLRRFRSDARFVELDTAQRAGQMHHEVPYSLPDSRGIIDVVYQDAAGKWQVVDFKTDSLPDEATLDSASNRHTPQLRQYRVVTEQLLGQSVIPMLCFLDVGGSVRWVQTD